MRKVNVEYIPSGGFSKITSKKEAALVANFLNQIKEANENQLTPELIVNYARDAKSPIHQYFTWDDGKAAELYRITEARGLLNSLSVKQVIGGKVFKIGAFSQVIMPGNKSSYAYIEDIYANPEYLRQLKDDYDRAKQRAEEMFNFFYAKFMQELAKQKKK